MVRSSPSSLYLTNCGRLAPVAASASAKKLSECYSAPRGTAWSARAGGARGEPGHHRAPGGAADRWVARVAHVETVVLHGLRQRSAAPSPLVGARPTQARLRVHLARPRRRAAFLPAGRGDVPRPNRRGGPGASDLRGAASSLHAAPQVLVADPRSRTGGRARPAGGRAALARRSAVGLPLPPALSLRHGSMQGDRTCAAGSRAGPPRPPATSSRRLRTDQETAPEPYRPVNRRPLRNRSSA